MEGKLVVGNGEVGIERDRFFGCLRPFLKFAEGRVNHSGQEPEWLGITRIGSRPRLAGLLCLFGVPRHLGFVGGGDDELLGVAHAVP